MYESDNIITMTPASFAESIRKRPGMYLRSSDSKGIINLISGIIKECIEICGADEFVFTVAIIDDNSFSIEINAEKNLLPFLQHLTKPTISFENFYANVLIAITERLEFRNDSIHFLFIKGKPQVNDSSISADPQTRVVLNFVLDKSVFNDTEVDYLALNEGLILIAILNRKTEIIVKELGQKYLSQNYYHFPQGVFYVFERLKNEVLGRPKFEIKYEGSLGENKYQIAIAYRTDWYPSPSITSFANDVQTVNGGSLVNGVIDGLALGCRKYVKANGLSNHVIKRKSFLSRLILVCAIRGGDFEYGGSLRETLESEEVRAQARTITEQMIFNYLRNNGEIASEFLFRFDITKQFL